MPDVYLNPVPSVTSGSLPKVAIVCHSHPSVTKGGAEVAAYALFRGLRQIGVDAIFIGACDEANRHRLAFSDSNEFAVYYDAERYEHFYHLAPRSVEEQLIRIIRDQRVGVVNFHHFLNIGLNSLRAVQAMPAIQCFYTMHEFLAMCQNDGQMVTRGSHLLCSQATNEACVHCFPEVLRSEFAMRKETVMDVFGRFGGFIAPSQFLADRFVNWGLPDDRTVVIENGLLGSTLHERKLKTDSLWTFGYFGQINPFKGVDVILAAAALIAADAQLANTIRVRIHGNFVGQPQSFVDQFNTALGTYPFLSYSGAYNSSSVYRLMSDCDYVLVPSKWWENSPVVIQEAYSVDTPVICSGIGGLAEKVHDGISGLHFDLGNARDLVRVMRIASDPNVAERLRAGIPTVTSASDMARSYARFFSVASSRGKVEVLIQDRGG